MKTSGPIAPPGARRWLLSVHQLPSTPSNLRVRTWRRLQQIGAIPIKQSVYLLPDTPQAREDFEWLKTEIESSGGEASVFAADNVDRWSDDALVEEFRRTRREAYGALAREVETSLKRFAGKARRSRARVPDARRALAAWRQRFAAIESIDFFGGDGRDRVASLLKRWEDELSPSEVPARPAVAGKTGASAFRRRLWVTRPRPGVDRMASAWLIRRFIDPDARFGFAPGPEGLAPDAIPYDMFGVELTHRGTDCTFETLSSVFEIRDPSVARIAEIVHDLDLKDGRFGPPEAAAIGIIIEGLTLANADDQALLKEGMVLFEALYRSFDRSARLLSGRRRKPKSRRRGRSAS